MRLFLLLSILTIISFFSAQAQVGTITGRILDDSNLPLSGASIILDNKNGVISDEDGYYALTNVAAGEHTLFISFIGYLDINRDIQINAGEVIVENIFLKPGVELSEIVVTSQLRGQARALNRQLSGNNITNIIAADQIGRFPDANVGDAIKRIPGINVQYDQGEARFGNIRGTAPQLNSVMIDGERIPSAEAEIRSVQLDLIPSDMVQAIEVNKAITPDMDADAIGGAVNLVTRSAPSERRISGTLGGGYNLLAEEFTYNGSLIYGERFLEDKLGLIASASYFDNNLGSDNVEAEWTYQDENENGRFDEGENFNPEEIQIRQYYLQRIRQSYSLSLDYQINPKNSIVLKGIYNRRKDWENRYRSVFKDIELGDDGWVAELERQSKGGSTDTKNRRLEDQQTANLGLSGKHILGKLSLDWSVNYARASEDRPNERYFEFATDDVVPVTVDFSNTREPLIAATNTAFQNPSNSWEFSELTEEFQSTQDEDLNARVDFSLPLTATGNNSLLKMGVRARTKRKSRSNDFYEYSPNSDQLFNNSLTNLENESKDNFLAGDYQIGSFTSVDFLGNLDLTDGDLEEEQDLSELAGNFDADENIYAAYAMVEQKLSDKLLGILGVRVEQTDLRYRGFIFDDEEGTLTSTDDEENNYLNVFPGLHLKYNLTNKSVLRFAATNTLARPNYFDLVPYRQIEDGEDLSVGNPSLEPTLSYNFDLMAEHYFGNVGILSGGIFYKDIQDFIVNERFDDFEFDGQVWANFSRPINGGNARLLGIETSFQRQLDFISSSLSNVGIYLNYTYINSEVTDFNFEGREDDELSLPGSPEHTLNASLAYDAKRFTSRISLNYASNFIDEVGEESFNDRYYDSVTYLDANFSYSINKKWVLYLNANNLLNQPLRFFQGNTSRVMQAEFYNTRFDLGVKFDITK